MPATCPDFEWKKRNDGSLTPEQNPVQEIFVSGSTPKNTCIKYFSYKSSPCTVLHSVHIFYPSFPRPYLVYIVPPSLLTPKSTLDQTSASFNLILNMRSLQRELSSRPEKLEDNHSVTDRRRGDLVHIGGAVKNHSTVCRHLVLVKRPLSPSTLGSRWF